MERSAPLGLCTRSLDLRPLAEDDGDFYCALYTDAELLRHVGPPLSEERARQAFAAVLRQLAAAPPKARYWIFRERGRDAPLGLMALVFDADRSSAEVGVLLPPGLQGRGYASEAIAALADHVFGPGGLTALWTRHAADNPGAIGLMRRLGFERVPAPETEPRGWRWRLLRRAWRPGIENAVDVFAKTGESG